MIVRANIGGQEYQVTTFEAQSALFSLAALHEAQRSDLLNLLFEAVIRYPHKITPVATAIMLSTQGIELLNFKWGLVTCVADYVYALKPEVTIVLRLLTDQMGQKFGDDALLNDPAAVFAQYISAAVEEMTGSKFNSAKAEVVAEILFEKVAQQPPQLP